jgi:hypothetical protein
MGTERALVARTDTPVSRREIVAALALHNPTAEELVRLFKGRCANRAQQKRFIRDVKVCRTARPVQSRASLRSRAPSLVCCKSVAKLVERSGTNLKMMVLKRASPDPLRDSIDSLRALRVADAASARVSEGSVASVSRPI